VSHYEPQRDEQQRNYFEQKAKIMQVESNITDELYQWGWWAQDCPSRSLNYPSKSNFTVVKNKSSSINITDDRAIEIDKAIAHLFNGDENLIKALKLYFVCGFSYRDIGKATGVSKDKAKSMIDNCVSWLEGYFYKKG
jgi:DNA-directed RNA polymerase specialized sigma24 family protein